MKLIERLKRLNLVDVLKRVYGMKFKGQGDGYVALSPFKKERCPSFWVRQERDGHWVFKDYSSGWGGSLFDFVALQENLGSFSQVFKRVCALTATEYEPLGAGAGAGPFFCSEASESATARGSGCREDRGYDIQSLYQRFRAQDAAACRAYLVERGIDEPLVDRLIQEGTVVCNRFEKGTYCCFAVRGSQGDLRCLYNRRIAGSGPEKFVLGPKEPFTLDWAVLSSAPKVFLCEGPIDYLSLKTLEGEQLTGVALLGNQLNVDRSLLASARQLIAAFDADSGGFSALYDLREAFEECQVDIYPMEECKDPNELLQAKRAGRARVLSPEQKVQLYREFSAAQNKAEVARRWQLNRSYLYELVKECEETLKQEFGSRRRGRPAKNQLSDLDEARRRLAELEEKYEQEATERERLYCRSEFLKLKLKWAQMRGGDLQAETGPARKPHAKKKRSKKR